MNKVIRDGNVAVLYSPNYGAGWYSWHHNKELLFSPEIVSIIETFDDCDVRYDKIIEYMDENYPDVYAGGAGDLTITWLSEGDVFEIQEYDGYESIRTLANIDNWLIA